MVAAARRKSPADPTLDELWAEVDLAQARRDEVKQRASDLGAKLAEARRALADARTDEDREEARTALAPLLAEATVVPEEAAAAADVYATAAHHWAAAGFAEVKAIRAAARRKVEEAAEREADGKAELERGDEARSQKVRDDRIDRTTLAIQASGRADKALRDAESKARPLLQAINRVVRPIFPSTQPREVRRQQIGEIVDGCVTGHERFLAGARKDTEALIEGRR